MKFQDKLPGVERTTRIDWITAKKELIANEGQWGLIAEDVSSSTPNQIHRGLNINFRGEELNHFEFASRKPEDPSVTYRPKRSDLWGRYTKEAKGATGA